VYLAKQDLDVWGMDYRWALVRWDSECRTIMRDWGVDQDIADGLAALGSPARLAHERATHPDRTELRRAHDLRRGWRRHAAATGRRMVVG